MMERLTSSSLAGTSRKLVAVGTSRLAAMLVAMSAAAPRSGSPGSAAADAAEGGAEVGAGALAAGSTGAGVTEAVIEVGLGVPAALVAIGADALAGVEWGR